MLKILLLSTILTVTAQSVECPIHDSPSTFTGKTKTVSGVMLWEYHCPRDGGHTFWVRQR